MNNYLTKQAEFRQKTIDKIIELVMDSGMKVTKRDYLLDLIGRLVGDLNFTMAKNVQKNGRNQDLFDKSISYLTLLGVSHVAVDSLEDRHFRFIEENYDKVKQPITAKSLNQLVMSLKAFETIEGQMPETWENFKQSIAANINPNPIVYAEYKAKFEAEMQIPFTLTEQEFYKNLIK